MLNRKILRHRGTWLIASAAVALCTATAVLTGAVPASAASQPAARSTVRTVVARVSRLPALPAGVKPASALPSCDHAFYNRTHECWLNDITFTFKQDGEPVGTLNVLLEQYITLVYNSAKWSEEDKVLSADPEGITAPVEFILFATCGIYCGAESHFFGLDMAAGDEGSTSYSTNIGKNTMFTASNDYILLYGAPTYIPETILSWDSLQPFRCDNGVATTGTGCVVPAFIPTLDISRSTYGAAAAMIQWSQKELKTHWGVEGKGEPLRRLKNTKVKNHNRSVICQTAWTAFPPWKAGSLTMSDSCDEFPFAATYESGALNGVKSGAACAQVKAVKTSSKGDNPAKLWNNIDVISYSPNDKCVRGHIPIKLNTDLGSKAYNALIMQARLINRDPFWVAVTS
jgi:hypothetical protein